MENSEILGVQRGKVRLCPYQEEWSSLFEMERSYLAEKLNMDWSNVHHIGSTSIPGCVAKPIIDIAICYETLFDSHQHQRILTKTPYGYNEIYYLPDRICYTKGDPQRFHLYLVAKDSSIFNNWILFKVLLCSNPILVEEYNDLKIVLSSKFANNRNEYTKAKTSFILSTLNTDPRWKMKALSVSI